MLSAAFSNIVVWSAFAAILLYAMQHVRTARQALMTCMVYFSVYQTFVWVVPADATEWLAVVVAAAFVVYFSMLVFIALYVSTGNLLKAVPSAWRSIPRGVFWAKQYNDLHARTAELIQMNIDTLEKHNRLMAAYVLAQQRRVDPKKIV